MKFRDVFCSSIVALFVVACGPADDQSKPDEGKTKIPEKSPECVAAGDLCQLENNQWVIHKKPEEKPQDEPPVADSSFDYSDIGVTDNLLPERKGFGFYHKGPKSPLDITRFKNVTLSPSISWSSAREYDEALYNFVAIQDIDASKKDEKNPIKFMFDKIGVENQTVNENKNFFGKGWKNDGGIIIQEHDTTSGNIGLSSISTHATNPATYEWNRVPALVNTFMYKNNKGKWDYYFADSNKKLFHNQEEQSEVNEIGSGAMKIRVYGVNAFLQDTTVSGNPEKNILSPSTLQVSGTNKEDKFDLEGRGNFFKHVNVSWYKLNNIKERKKKAEFSIHSGSSVKFTTALMGYNYDASAKTRAPFPTDIELDTLDSVQFGRLTGEGVDREADDITGYNKKNLKEYLFTAGKAATGGNDKGEDWYFARGTEATPVAVLENYKKAGRKIAYDGQAVMFGLDYKPTQVIKKNGKDEDGQSTNSVKPADPKATLVKTPLDGKQNFVRMEWDAETGEITGRVYGVWTLATYWREIQPDGGEKLITISTVKTPPDAILGTPAVYNTDILSKDDGSTFIVFKDAAKASSFVKDYDKGSGVFDVGNVDETNSNNISFQRWDVIDKPTAENIAKSAYQLEPWFVTLVAMKGQVKEGTNAFGGEAIRVKDNAKGLFAGGFFGSKGLEIGGVINSQTGSMKNKDLTDPNFKWGGAFGAKFTGTDVEEDLIFTDTPVDYMTSTEVWSH